jgi:hypothetical protein
LDRIYPAYERSLKTEPSPIVRVWNLPSVLGEKGWSL